MSIFDKLRGPAGPPGMMGAQGGPPDMSKAFVFVRDCSFCNAEFATCTRFGQLHFICEKCEYKVAERLKLILKFQ